MGMFGRMFGSDNAIQAVIDTGDKVFFTDEEKADNHHRLLKSYAPFRITQRLLALVFCLPYMLFWIATTVVAACGYDTESMRLMLDGNVSSVVWTIAGFYFGGGTIEGIVRAARKGD